MFLLMYCKQTLIKIPTAASNVCNSCFVLQLQVLLTKPENMQYCHMSHLNILPNQYLKSTISNTRTLRVVLILH